MKLILTFAITIFCSMVAQTQVMSPELLWQLKRVSPVGLSDDGQSVIFRVSQYDIEANYPFLQINVILCLGVEVFEDPVHDDLLAQVQIVVKELSESPSGDLTGVVLTVL